MGVEKDQSGAELGVILTLAIMVGSCSAWAEVLGSFSASKSSHGPTVLSQGGMGILTLKPRDQRLPDVSGSGRHPSSDLVTPGRADPESSNRDNPEPLGDEQPAIPGSKTHARRSHKNTKNGTKDLWSSSARSPERVLETLRVQRPTSLESATRSAPQIRARH